MLNATPALLIVVVRLAADGRRREALGLMRPLRRVLLANALAVAIAQVRRAQRCVRGQTGEVTRLIAIHLMRSHRVVGQRAQPLPTAPRALLSLDAGTQLDWSDDRVRRIRSCHRMPPLRARSRNAQSSPGGSNRTHLSRRSRLPLLRRRQPPGARVDAENRWPVREKVLPMRGRGRVEALRPPPRRTAQTTSTTKRSRVGTLVRSGTPLGPSGQVLAGPGAAGESSARRLTGCRASRRSDA